MAVRVGISGWVYPPWRGVFYPPTLPQKRELAYAAERLSTIEINGTFYSLQKPDSFAKWAAAVPDGFVFSVKAPRFMTHVRRLAGYDEALPNFLASGVLRLADRLGPILWQLPPTLAFDAQRVGAFLAALPKTTAAAADLATRHGERMAGRAWTRTDADRPLRHAIEPRHESFACRAFVDMARDAGVAIVCADAVEWPRLMEVTADFVYCRLQGARGDYDDTRIAEWAARIAAWRDGGHPADAEFIGPPPRRRRRDVFVYFDREQKTEAPAHAMRLREIMGV